ncbi:hypothetical protein Taro_004857 [Colocasia esculenta]|uniref:Uncharacterized protein n=1 Tax=Colocasia esculenta TaxID=4460 RepID=A0A843TSU7_COLES|nr:hypothetical protein [Colocasia esculenta]
MQKTQIVTYPNEGRDGNSQSEPVQMPTPSIAPAGIFGWLSAPRTRLEPLEHSLFPQQYAFQFSRVTRPILALDSPEQYRIV